MKSLPKLAPFLARIREHGPTRVVVETEGREVARAVTPGEALLHFGIVPDVALIRDDGWSLGARRQDLDAAHRLWAGKWISEVEI